MTDWKDKTFHAKIKVSHESMHDMLITALEGGSTYWYRSAHYEIPQKHQEEVGRISDGVFCGYWAPFFEGALTFRVANFDDEKLPVRTSSVSYEDADPAKTTWRLELEDLFIGAQIMADKYPRHFADMVNGDFDADTGDVFLQCCAFGEVIFG